MSDSVKWFYIQNLGYCGDCLRWWKRSGNGSTSSDLNEAWRVPEAVALDICRNRPWEDIPWPAEIAEAASSRHVNSEHPIARKFMAEGAQRRREAARRRA